MATSQATTRANQLLASALHAGFTGVVSVLLLPLADEVDLKFTANVTYQTGDSSVPSITFSPCTDAGVVKEFNDADDCIKWLNGAFFDIDIVTISIDDFTSINKPFVPPTDAIKFATAKKAMFAKKVLGMVDKVMVAEGKVTANIALGWPTSQYPALVQLHVEDVKRRDTVLGIKAFYVAEVARYNAIIVG
jgi:hypothetical protein